MFSWVLSFGRSEKIGYLCNERVCSIMQSLLFFLLQMDGKMRPSDRMPDEDLGPLPSLGEYFTYVGLGVACLLVMWLLVKLHDKVEEKSSVLSGILTVLGFAALLGAGFFLIPVAMVWYTWAIVAGVTVLVYAIYEIYERWPRPGQQRPSKRVKKPRINIKDWETITTLSAVYLSYAEKPDASIKPRAWYKETTLDRKIKQPNQLFINKSCPVEYNPYYRDSSVGDWSSFDFRYKDLLNYDQTVYGYFTITVEDYCAIPEDVWEIFVGISKQKDANK